MALFKRADLEAQGLTKEQADYVMTEANRSLAANYAPKSDIQSQIDAAVQAAAANAAPVDVKTTQEYIDLQRERDMLRAIGGDDFAGVKPKFRETVFGMLDRGEKAPAVQDQLKAIGEKYEEYFLPAEPKQDPQQQQQQQKNTPQYSQAPGRPGTNPESKEDELFRKLSESWK